MKKIFSFIQKAFCLYITKGVAGLSAQLSYYMLFTFFPVLLLINSILGRIIPRDFDIPLSSVVPAHVKHFADVYIREMDTAPGTALVAGGCILALYSLSRYIRYFRAALRKICCRGKKRKLLSDFLISLIFSVGIMGLFCLAVFSVFVTDIIFEAPGTSGIAYAIWYILRFLIMAMYGFFTICFLNYIELSDGQSFSDFVPGSLFSVVLWTVISVAFSFYVKRISNHSVIYGSIGNTLMLLLWLNLTNNILLMSSVVNICLKKKH